MKVLLLILEFPLWPDAAKYTYECNFGIEEGLAAKWVDYIMIPVMFYQPGAQWVKWFDVIRTRLQGRKFDQVWFETTHSAFPVGFLDFIDSLAPVRVGFVGEDTEFHPVEKSSNPVGVQARIDKLSANLGHATHLIAVDEKDCERFNREGNQPAFWWASGYLPIRLMAATPAPPVNAPAVFHGTLYGNRKAWFAAPELQGLLMQGSSLESQSPYPVQWNQINQEYAYHGGRECRD